MSNFKFKITAVKILFGLIISGLAFSCKDDDSSTTIDRTNGASRAELTTDSIFLYAKEIYFWNEDLPEYDDFAPRKYITSEDEIDYLADEIYGISKYALNPATGTSYEYLADANYPKYSFIEDNLSASSQLGAVAVNYLDGQDEGFGVSLAAIAINDIRVKYVTTGSPAYKAGLQRGDKLLEINGRTIQTTESDIDYVNNTFQDNSLSMKVEKADKSEVTVNLTQTTYDVNPVFKDAVIEAGDNKVGYLAYDMFSSLDNSKEVLTSAFSKFAASQVKDLIVDLRYNGGGYVATADFLINNIIPERLTGSVMYTEHFNEQMRTGNATILKNQIYTDSNGDPVKVGGRNATYFDIDYSDAKNLTKFEKTGPLQTVENVYFIITGETASSSELVINTLQPYMNVTLIGSTSYGKPVGFFGINIDKYTMYIPNFETINSNGEGQYYSGFTPDVTTADDPTHDFADPDEACIAQAIAIINGTYDPNSRNARANADKLVDITFANRFNGMIEDRSRWK